MSNVFFQQVMPSIFDYFTNSSIINGALLYLSSIQVYLVDPLQVFRETDQLTVAGVLNFDDFQLNLLKVFSGVLIVNLLLLVTAWKYYGADIYDRFLKLSNTKEIEELKASVSKLKLPKEHTPRI
ncbi:unnamed protein product [Ceutorhynchus assimilis]|uniref:Uncharacterized protein n=1 Tax=Ceutorhynchus assimilis TaxID=467358 RepID=A0A9N9MPH3_9CUCU|nr:unnamed protein product [Ceutorhynchus assimilis]